MWHSSTWVFCCLYTLTKTGSSAGGVRHEIRLISVRLLHNNFRGKRESPRELKPREFSSFLKFLIVILRIPLLRIIKEHFFLLPVEFFGQFQALVTC